MLLDVISRSKARYLLVLMIIYEEDEVMLNHSFVRESGRYVDCLKSENFHQLIEHSDEIRKKA